MYEILYKIEGFLNILNNNYRQFIYSIEDFLLHTWFFTKRVFRLIKIYSAIFSLNKKYNVYDGNFNTILGFIKNTGYCIGCLINYAIQRCKGSYVFTCYFEYLGELKVLLTRVFPYDFSDY